MYTKFITLASLAVTVLAAEPQPYKLAKMSMNLGVSELGKRQAGYDPSTGQVYCGSGATCAEACGPTYITCPSNDSTEHCYDPTILKETCCPDNSGNSCSDGYFCTSDTKGATWCCPDGMSLSACAAAYSLTDVLVSQTPIATPTVPASSPATASASSTPTTTKTATSSTTTAAPSVTKTPTASGNGTVTKTTTSQAIQVTNAAAAGHVAGGLGGLMVAAGALLAL